MKSIVEEKRDIPVAGETDVLVLGGGLAGVAAAVAARRNGAKVTLIEKSIVLGGLATLGHVCIYLPLDDGVGHRVYGGLAEELLHVCIKYGFNDLPACWKERPKFVKEPSGRYQSAFNIPACVLALDELMQDEGVDVVFDTNFCQPVMEGDTCIGAIVENKSGRSAYLAKMFIDATGDADVFFRAGAPCEEQKSIVSHWAYEIDAESMKKGAETGSMADAVSIRWLGLRPDADNSASTLPTFYGTTSDAVNGYIRASRRLALEYIKANQRPDYAMLTLPFMPQFRMTRRLVGKETMAVAPGAPVPHSVGCVIFSLEAPAAVYEFPYEGLIDSRITNIAAAGRIVSAAGRGWEIMRFIPACVLSGQAAGTAVAMAAKARCTLQALDVTALQENLSAAGVMIHMDETLRNNSKDDVRKKPGKKAGIRIRSDSLSFHD